MCSTLLLSSAAAAPPQLREGRGMSLQEGDKLTMKSRGRNRGWLSARREGEVVVVVVEGGGGLGRL